MHTKDLLINDRCKRKILENFCTVPPDINATILSQAFILEAVHLCDLARLMVATN